MNTDLLCKFTDRITRIEGLDVARGPTSLNVSWSTNGSNAEEYEIKIWTSQQELIGTYLSNRSEYSITELEPCQEYRIGVSPMPINENNTAFINTTTEFEGKKTQDIEFLFIWNI